MPSAWPTLIRRWCALAVLASATVRADPPPPAVMARMNRAGELVQQGKFTEALDSLITPTIAEFEQQYRHSKQRVYCANGSVETLLYLTKAAAEKQDAIAVDGGYAYAYFMRGYILIEKHDVPGAVKSINRALELSPSNSQFLSELGNIYQNKRDWPKAMELYEQAAEHAALFDHDGSTSIQRRALRGQAFVLVELGKLDEAEKLYRHCLELESNDRIATSELLYLDNLRLKSAK